MPRDTLIVTVITLIAFVGFALALAYAERQASSAS
jgi:hypothetical protein